MLEGIEAIVLRTVGDQQALWEAVLPPELLVLPTELARVDALLDDPAFFALFVPFFDPRFGRPSTPMETYLRLMFLKFRYRLGYESLCREVSDSITWRRFCRIGLNGSVPHPTDVDEADHPLRQRRSGRIEPSAAGQGCGGEAAAHHPAAGRYDRGGGQRVLPDRRGSASQGGAANRCDWAADPGRWRRDPHADPGSFPLGRQTGARDRGEVPGCVLPRAGTRPKR